MRVAAGAAVALGLAACNPPPPRDVSYFVDHPDETTKLIAACTASGRSHECDNAQTAQARITAKARMERYRKGFE
ncbi:EexN family lipoprotein [Phenylobacterium sp.]|uniref:EexN family lipoprotein n=1 Tax=Phenylobacterium sp. TaxID=1871053 RepID=UPI003BA84CB2